MEWIVIFGYSFALLIISLFSLEQLYLAFLYRKGKKNHVHKPLHEFPLVTVQLPIYNEKYVIERLIDCVCTLDYPKDKLEIQVLDDSTDETSDLVVAKIAEWTEKGINIRQVIRSERIGFKAGALQYGLQEARGEYIAIFDADFLPDSDFLLKTLPAFEEGIGMVQTRWGHINQEYSILTRMQAFGLNAHFTVEQGARNSSGKFMNFNGTAGIWRKTCIEEAGGWQHDTLTEDLDLSYRAQLKGWKFQYLEDVTSPAELPVLVTAIKSQQYRWNKGAAETARKNCVSILKSSQSFQVKLHALLHLFNSSVFLFLLLAAVLSIPVLFVKSTQPVFEIIFNLGGVFIVGFVGMTIFYWVSARAATPHFSLKYYLIHFPLFLIFSMGMALHNAIAVTEGYLGIKSPFIRTPKFNIRSKKDSWKGNSYLTKGIAPLTIMEGLLALYFVFGVVTGIQIQNFGLLLFHTMLALGFGAVFFLSIKPFNDAKAG